MNEFSVAILGDGVIERWGSDLPELRAELERLYSHSTFELFNHGLEGSRVGNALWRVSHDGPDASKSLSYRGPGIVVVESCAFSQFWDGPEGLSEYRDALRRLWDEIERTTRAKRLFAIAAAPPRDRFLEAIPLFYNTSKATRARFADAVKMFVAEARAIAEDEGWPLADCDAEVARRVAAGEPIARFFDQGDSRYPSRLGYTLAARIIVREMDNARFIEERIQK